MTLLEAGASQDPESPALLDVEGRKISYKSLVDSSLRFSGLLVSQGIQRGDRVAWVVPSGPDAAVAFFAISGVATSVPIRNSASFDEIRALLEGTQARAVVLSEDAQSEASAAADGLHLPIIRLPARFPSTRRFQNQSAPDSGSSLLPYWERPEPDDVAVILPSTAGSGTAQPCQVPLTHRNLVSAARHVAASLELQKSDRCLNLLPLEGMHGLIGCLLASISRQASVICAPGFCSRRLGSWLFQGGPTWFSAVPAMYDAWIERLESSGERLPGHALRFVRSCSASLPARLQKALESTLKVPVIEAYCVSEAGHQIASNPLPPRLRKPGSVGLPTGTRVAILGESELPLPPGQLGEIVVRGDGVTPGCPGNPEFHRRSFVQGWFRTGDLGHVDGDGYLFLAGRALEEIQRGAERIFPLEIEAVLVAHPGVTGAVAFPRPHPTLGQDLVAAVVLREGAAATENGLRAFAFDRLPPAKVPSRILILDQLPRDASGKFHRESLARELASQLRVPSVLPRNDIEVLVAEIWSSELECSEFGVDDNFFTLGGDPGRAARIVSRLNDLFQLALPVLALLRHPTVRQLTGELERLAHPALLETISENVRDLGTLSPTEILAIPASPRPPSASTPAAASAKT